MSTNHPASAGLPDDTVVGPTWTIGLKNMETTMKA